MWKITIEDDEGKQTTLPLDHDEYGVGRGEANAIRLTDRNVSRKHAMLRKNGAAWALSDFESYNGTYVNGVRVTAPQDLAAGDVVQLGDYRLEVIDDASVKSSPDAALPSTDPASAPQQRPNRLVVIVGPTPGAEFPLSGDHLTVGRAEDATISINHASISRLHAELFALANGRYEVVDKDSANGVRINGVELKRGMLEAGDALELGDVRLRFVGAGKLFRAGSDKSQQLVAVSGYEAIAEAAPSPIVDGAPRPGMGKLVAVGVGVAAVLLVIVAAVALNSPGSSPSGATTGAAAAGDAAEALVAAAKALAAKGDLDAAHAKLKALPEASGAASDAAVADLEGRWADMMLQKAVESTDPAERRRLLREVTTAPNVPKDRRTKAISLMDSAPDPTPAEASVGSSPRASGAPVALTAAGSTSPVAMPAKSAELATPPAAAAAPLNDTEAKKKRLEPRVWSGKASLEEIAMLKALCSQLGDRACRDRASAMMKKKKQEGGN